MNQDKPNWEGLLKWSLSHSDGTLPQRQLRVWNEMDCNVIHGSEDDRRWFMEAMQSQTIDVVKRMKEITQVMQTPEQVLETQGVTLTEIEGMLDELQEHVESIDMANDLYSIGGLPPLLGYLKNRHANIRAKAADVVATIVQNNPRSQQLVMEANGFEPLLTNFTSDADMHVRTQALGAISSLIRHNKPGISAFRLANGYAALKDALSSESVRFQRKALSLLHYLLKENQGDSSIVTELGFPRIMMHLASNEDPSIREAAMQGLLELTRGKPDDISGSFIDEDGKMKQLLEERIQGISKMSQDELSANKEERHLVDTLWRAFYNEPSSLGEKGLLILPGEEDDGPPPDVASKLFEPPLRAWAAKREPDQPSEPEKKEAPLLLSPGPSNNSANGSVNGVE